WRNPGVVAGAEHVVDIVPGIATRRSGARDGLELPQQRAVVDVVGADEALFRTERRALSHAGENFAGGHQRTAGVAEAFADRALPDFLAVDRVQRNNTAARRVDDQL